VQKACRSSPLEIGEVVGRKLAEHTLCLRPQALRLAEASPLVRLISIAVKSHVKLSAKLTNLHMEILTDFHACVEILSSNTHTGRRRLSRTEVCPEPVTN
jgi:hypothetical protein